MIDFKKFKKVGSDKHMTTLKHDDGHEIKIVHSALSPKLRKDLERIPMADGGEVKVDEETRDTTPQDLEGVTKSEKYPEAEDRARPDDVAPSASQEAPQPPPSAPGTQENPVMEFPPMQVTAEQPHEGLSVLSGPSQPPLLQKIQDITQPNPQLTGQMQNAYSQQQMQQQQLMNSFQQHKQALDNEHAAIVHDIMNNHINMSDYWHQNDKGAAALGALLGGMGSGLTHIANPVPGMIQASQENFLRAQMANQDSDKSLLNSLQAQYGNNRDAADMARVISNEMLGSQLAKVAAPLTSANAQAQSQQTQLALLQNTEMLKQQIAMRQALSSQGRTQIDPAQKILLMYRAGYMNDKQYEAANKELSKAQEVESLRSEYHNSFNDLNNQILGGTFSPNDRESARNSVAGRLEHLAEGRFNLQEAQQQADAVLPQRVESNTTRGNKRQRGDALLDQLRSTPTLDGLGIQVPKVSQQPSAPETATMGGKLYQKVPGGWVPAQ